MITSHYNVLEKKIVWKLKNQSEIFNWGPQKQQENNKEEEGYGEGEQWVRELVEGAWEHWLNRVRKGEGEPWLEGEIKIHCRIQKTPHAND